MDEDNLTLKLYDSVTAERLKGKHLTLFIRESGIYAQEEADDKEEE